MAQESEGSGVRAGGQDAVEETFELSRDTGEARPDRDRQGDGSSTPETTPEGEASNPHAHLGSEAPADAKGAEAPPTSGAGVSDDPEARSETAEGEVAEAPQQASAWTPPSVDGPVFDQTPQAGPLDNPGRSAPPERTQTTVFSSGSNEPGGLPESDPPAVDLPSTPPTDGGQENAAGASGEDAESPPSATDSVPAAGASTVSAAPGPQAPQAAPAPPADNASTAPIGATPVDPQPVNAAPTDLALDNASVAENAAGAVVGGLSVADPDVGDTHSYVVSDPRFEVVDGQLKLKDGVSLDHETEPTVSVTVTAYDGPPAARQTLWAETFAGLQAGATEDTGDTAWSAEGPDSFSGATHGVQSGAYEFSETAPDGETDSEGSFATWTSEPIDVSGMAGVEVSFDLAGRGSLNDSGRLHDSFRAYAEVDGTRHALLVDDGQVDSGHVHLSGIPQGESLRLVFEARTTSTDEAYRLDNIAVTGVEPTGLATTETFDIAVADVNEAPHDLALDSATLASDAAPGTVVGTFSASDVDSDTFTYRLVDQDGAPLGGSQRLDAALAEDPATPISVAFNGGGSQPHLTSMGRLFDGTGTDTHTVWRVRNPLDTDVEVTLDPNGPDNETIALTLPANSDTFVASTETRGAATHRLLQDGEQVAVKAAGSHAFSYGQQVETGGHPLFEIVGDRLVLKEGASLDAATDPTVWVEVTDEGGLGRIEPFQIDVQDPPVPVRFTFSNATRDQGETQDRSDSYTVEATAPGGRIVDGAEMDIRGVADDDSVRVSMSEEGRATADLRSEWNSIKNVLAEGEGGADVRLRDFVDVEVNLGDGGDSRVDVDDAKRGRIATGDGDDTVDVRAQSNGRGWDNAFAVDTGAGDDSVTIRGDRDLTTAEVNAGAGDDTVRFRGDGDATLAGGAGDDVLRGDAGDDRLYGDSGSSAGGTETGSDAAQTGTLVARGGGFRFTVSQDGAETYNERADGDRVQGGRLEASMGDGVLSIRPEGEGSWLNVHGGEGIGVYTEGEQANSGNKTVDGGEALILEIGPDAARSGASAAQVTVRSLGEGESLRVEALRDGQSVGEQVFEGTAAQNDTFAFAPSEGVTFDSLRLSGVDGSSFYFREARLETTDLAPADEPAGIEAAGADRLYGGDGDDIAYGGAGDDRLYGGDGNDALYGEAGDDRLRGGHGDDTLDGGAGDDDLRGQQGDDILAGGAGDDRLRGDAGADTLYGGEGNDDLRGGSGDDAVTGGAGDDVLRGDAGADTLSGGAGSDTLSGGDGDDVLEAGDGGPSGTVAIGVANATATDQGFRVTGQRIVDGELTETSAENLTISDRWGIGVRGASGGADDQVGFDEESGLSERINIEFDGPVGEADVTVTRLFANEGENGETGLWRAFLAGQEVGSGTFAAESGHELSLRIATDGGFDLLQFEGLPLDAPGADASEFYLQSVQATFLNDVGTTNTLQGGSGSDRLLGAGGADTLSGGEGTDILQGGAGDDDLDGGADDDVMTGGQGADRLSGGAGNDVLDGGAGDDVLDGGAGDDLFVFAAGGGVDSVSGGNGAWTDVIQMQGMSGPPDGVAWTVQLDQGEAVADEAGLVLSEDAAGTITLADGSEISFEGIERIDW